MPAPLTYLLVLGSSQSQPCTEGTSSLPDTDLGAPVDRAIPTTCIETIGGDPDTAIRLSFQIKVF